jgi:signal transduction histidine kinase/ActR/RegA family two-component response regulator
VSARGFRPSIRLVLICGFVLVTASAVAVLTAFRYVWLTTEEVKHDLRQDLVLARSVQAGLERYFTLRRHALEAVAAEIGEIGLGERQALDRLLERARRRDSAFTSLLAVDLEGVARAVSPPLDAEGQPNVGKRFGDRHWFREALAPAPERRLELVIGRNTLRPAVGLGAVIRRPTGETAGVLGGGLDLDELRRSLRQIDSERTDRLVVVDAAGRVVVHSSPEWEAAARDLSGEGVFRAAQAAAEGTTQYVSEFTGVTRWAAHVRVPSAGWIVWTSRGPETQVARIQGLAANLAVSGLLAVLLAALLAAVISRYLTRPVTALAAAARDLEARRFDDRSLLVRDSRIREFAELLGGFRAMAAAVQITYLDLEAQVAERTRSAEDAAREARATAARLRVQEEIRRGYGELAALLNSLDRSYILNDGTRKIATSLRAPLAAVYLTDDGPESLRLKTYAALDSTLLDAAALASTGVPSEVARRRAAVFLTGMEAAGRLTLDTGLGRLEVAAVAALPLAHQERLLGVLLVALVEPLTEDTRSFLDNAARQLSVALSNAALFESVRSQSQELEALNAALRRADAAKSEFLASMSHELRTPLNSIIGFTELLLASTREPLSERQRGALERVLGSGRHLLGLINDILDLSKIEAGRMDVVAAEFSLREVLQQCLATVEPQAAARTLALRTRGLGEAPAVVQDAAKVKQIVLNLLANAVKFTPEGSVELRVAAGSDATVEIAVADTGPGIAADQHERIFESFRQVQGGLAATGGTGLGLAISRRLAELLGGRLTVDSAPGAGSVFTLVLPVRYRPPAVVEDLPIADEVSTAGRPRLLVIDDDANAVELVRRTVAGRAIEVDGASSAAAGLWRAVSRRPALIFLDVVLQGNDDGWDALRTLKADPATKDIPVIVHSVIDNRHRAKALGADDVLVKPVTLEAMEAVLRRFGLAAAEPS